MFGEIFGLGVPEILVLLVIGVLLIGGTVLWVWALVDCLRNDFIDGKTKVTWVLIIILVYGLGAVLYLLVGRPKRVRDAER
jgi:hypothetical protein